MPEVPTSQWPLVRLKPSVKMRLEDLIEKAAPGTPVLQILSSLLDEALDQIESEDVPGIAPTVQRFRHALKKTASPPDLATRVLQLEQLMEGLHRAAEDHAKASEGKKKQAGTKKKSAA